MNDEKSDLIIVLLIVCYTLYAATLAFQLHRHPWKSTGIIRNPQVVFADNQWLAHQEVQEGTSRSRWQYLFDYIRFNSVCPFGKFGAWALLSWSVIMVVMLLVYRTTPYGSRKKMYQVLAIVNLVFAVLYFGMMLPMNLALFIRSLPYLITQMVVSAWLFMKSDCE